MMRQKVCFTSLFIIVLLAYTLPSSAQNLDSYGGTTAVKCPGGAKPHFYAAKIGNRWWLCDPAGNGFFLKGVYFIGPNAVSSTAGLAAKYATGATINWEDNWALEQVRRLQQWGFNATGEFSSLYVTPVVVDAWTTADHTIPVKAPFLLQNAVSFYSLTNSGGYASQAAKDIASGINSSVYGGYLPHMTDPFDPNFAQWLNGQLQHDYANKLILGSPHNDYFIAFDLDESDDTLALKAGPDFSTVNFVETGAVESGHQIVNGAWVVMVAAPTQASNSSLGVTYSDKTVYSKQDFSTFMMGRYASVAVLNAAWGSKYTTFGASGAGWGAGTGLLDEDGTCPSKGATACWIGDPLTLAGETAAMQADLSAYLTHWLTQYYSVQKTAYNTYAPGFMLTTELGGWGAPPRKEVLQVASQYVDFFTIDTVPPFPCSNCTDVQKRVNFVAQYGGDKPWVEWEGFVAQADSAESVYPIANADVATQQKRGQIYQQMITGLATAADSAGTYHIFGEQWWGWYDQDGQRLNWGLLTPSDNPYDGVSAVIAGGTDQWGYPTGGERANYGDFLTSVQSANLNAYSLLTGVPTATATIIPTQTPSRSPTHTPSGSPTHTPSGSPTHTPSGSPTHTPSGSPTHTPSRSPTHTPSGSPTHTPSGSPTHTPTRSPTHTPSGSPTHTPSGSPTHTPSGSPTHTPSGSPTHTPSGSPTHTPSGSPTHTPSGSPTHTPTRSPTHTPSGSPTHTPTRSPTPTPSGSPTHTPSRSPTPTPSRSPTHTPTRSPTPAQTPSKALRATRAPTHTPTHTPTRTSHPTPTPTPSLALASVTSPIQVGGRFIARGDDFNAGSVVNFFVATAKGPVNAGPLKPSSFAENMLVVPVNPSITQGEGFVTIQVVNTTQGSISSNTLGALLQGSAAAGLPSLNGINDRGIAADSTDHGVALANVETVVPIGKPFLIDGSGFDTVHGIAVDVFCHCPGGKVGPLFFNPGQFSATQVSLTLPATGISSPTVGPGSFRISNKGANALYSKQSASVAASIGTAITVSKVTQSADTVTVIGTGFATTTVINLFNAQGTGVVNLGGLKPDGSPRIPLTLIDSTRFSFAVPRGVVAGPGYVQAINPPFVPFSTSGNGPGGAFRFLGSAF